MQTFFRAVAVVSFLALATACGGQMDDASSGSDDLSSSFDPITAFPQVKKAAAAYTSGTIVAVSLNGQRQASASTTHTYTTSFYWVWTVMGSDGTFVDVQVNSASVKVLRHEKRYLFAGEATFDPAKVLVNGQDLLSISATLGLGQPTEIALNSTLAAQMTGPRYDVTYPNGGYMTIDGVTGQTSK